MTRTKDVPRPMRRGPIIDAMTMVEKGGTNLARVKRREKYTSWTLVQTAGPGG